jgi:hypothetical protein
MHPDLRIYGKGVMPHQLPGDANQTMNEPAVSSGQLSSTHAKQPD